MLTLTLREVIPAVVLLALGTQAIFASFFISILVSGSKSTSRVSFVLNECASQVDGAGMVSTAKGSATVSKVPLTGSKSDRHLASASRAPGK
jgi:hypothetical protein